MFEILFRAEHRRANIVNIGKSVELITITVSPSPFLLSLNRELFDFIPSVIWIVASLMLRATLWRLMTSLDEATHIKIVLPKELIQQKKQKLQSKNQCCIVESRTRLDIVARLLFNVSTLIEHNWDEINCRVGKIDEPVRSPKHEVMFYRIFRLVAHMKQVLTDASSRTIIQKKELYRAEALQQTKRKWEA